MGRQEAQMWRKDELMPKDLFPKIKSRGTVKPIKGPDIYQGQGCLIKSIMYKIINRLANWQQRREGKL